MPKDLENVLYYGNITFTILFALEMILKIFGLGFKNYIKDKFNIFDALVVITSLLEFVGVGSKAVLVFRCFRLLRIFKIIRSWKSLKKLLTVVFKSFQALANLAFLMALFCFIYGLIAFQFFSGKLYDYNGDE